MDWIIELRNITKRYAEHVALESFSLEIRRGEFLTVLGPSGSGKTTLLRLIAGFEQPESGQIKIEGLDTVSLPPYRRNVNTVFQQYALFPHLNVLRNVAFGLEQKKIPEETLKRRVRKVLELVQLPGKEERYPNQLSGGEKQRVALARALVLEPAVLLLDEPLAALDQKLRKQMQMELKRLREKVGITFVFVTHDQEEALVMSDRVAVINDGKLEQLGRPEEIYERPATPFVAEFMGAENFFEVKCTSATGGVSHFETLSGLALVAQGGHGVAENSPATFAVRPESIRLSWAKPSGDDRCMNLLRGELQEAIYEGVNRRWSVKLATGEHLVVRGPHDGAAEVESVSLRGSEVYLSWDSMKSLVYPHKGSY